MSDFNHTVQKERRIDAHDCYASRIERLEQIVDVLSKQLANLVVRFNEAERNDWPEFVEHWGDDLDEEDSVGPI